MYLTSSGGPMDKPNRVPQLYGYTVCLVAVITFLISINGVVGAAFDFQRPLQGEGWYEESFSSFDNWIASNRRPYVPEGQAAVPDTTSIGTLHDRYNALRADRIAGAKFRAEKTIAGSGLLV